MKEEVSVRNINIEKFIEKYRDKDFLNCCKKCNNYGKNWSCPPVDFDAEEYLKKYKNIELHLIKIVFTKEEIEESQGKDLYGYSLKILQDFKENYTKTLMERERETGAEILYPGSCFHCKNCQRLDNKPCVKPEKFRYSMDTFGINITKLAEEIFEQKILWGKEQLPDYYIQMFALLN